MEKGKYGYLGMRGIIKNVLQFMVDLMLNNATEFWQLLSYKLLTIVVSYAVNRKPAKSNRCPPDLC